MTARCGSNDPTHRASKCRDCDRVYKRRHRAGAPPFRMRVKADSATCIVCGLTAGNSLDVPVYRYPLKRWHNKGQAWIGTAAMCDDCLLERAEIKPQFRRVA